MNGEGSADVEIYKKQFFDAGLSEAELRAEKKEILFKAHLVSELKKVLEEAMIEEEIPDETIQEFFHEVSNLSDEAALAVMAIPLELQHGIFTAFQKNIAKGEFEAKDFLEQLLRRVKENGYRMAFHVSNREIQIKQTKDGKGEIANKWEVVGTEQDHRDEDLLRAYYSLDYINLYRKKPSKYLYMVRAQIGPDTPHRQDNNGAWGRASALPIVARLDLLEIDEKIEQALNEKNETRS